MKELSSYTSADDRAVKPNAMALVRAAADTAESTVVCKSTFDARA